MFRNTVKVLSAAALLAAVALASTDALARGGGHSGMSRGRVGTSFDGHRLSAHPHRLKLNPRPNYPAPVAR